MEKQMIVVNFSTKNYGMLQRRLRQSLNGHRTIMFSSYGQIGGPTHEQSPYEFKIHAIEKAFLHDDIVLWCDSSLWLVGNINSITDLIKQDGYFMEEAGHYVGSWTNEFTKDYFKMTDEESAVPGGIIMFTAGCLGLNRQSHVAMEFFRQWKEAALAGCFRGHWHDHRHDMTCASIIAQRLQMKFQRGGKHLAYVGPDYPKAEPSVVFKLKGYL
jgi:hypothetical protein